MKRVQTNNVALHVVDDGPEAGSPVVFGNSLGTDVRLWDAVLPLLPGGRRYVRFDLRGHGLSECPDGPYTIPDLSADIVSLIERLELGPLVFVGLSIGGMIGQHLAAHRPDLVRGLVLSNTAPKMGTPEMWNRRILAVEKNGLPSIESTIIERWFGPRFRATSQAPLWGAMLSRTPQDGYVACCKAIATADLSKTTKDLKLPTLAIAGSADGASPAETVAAMADSIPGARFHTIDGVGHLPCVEAPEEFAAILGPFLEEFSHA